MLQITTRLSVANEDLNYGNVYYTVFPIRNADVAPLLERKCNARRVLVAINGGGRLHGGLMPDGKGDWFITVNKEIRQRFGLGEGDRVDLTITPDDSDYGMPLPAEAAELWAMDEEAKRVFHQLSPGKQRGLLYQIAKPKGVDTRVKKAVQIHEYLKSVSGRLDYKELTAYMKSDNANWN